MKRVLKSGTSEVVEKKSRFIGVVLDIASAEDAMDKVNRIKKKYYDARHNCYAYICGANGEESRFSDDGEPSGTAGKPMLDILAGSGVTNCLVVVTRYFGGTLLGTGGLVKAYGSAARQALDAAVLTEAVSGVVCSVETDYNSVGKLQHIFGSNEIPVLDTVYQENVLFRLVMDEGKLARLDKILGEEFAGRLELEREDDVTYYVDETNKPTIL